ncbi:MAG: hypothetical protein ABIL70_05630 [candidate division WOR-3 bacterium]
MEINRLNYYNRCFKENQVVNCTLKISKNVRVQNCRIDRYSPQVVKKSLKSCGLKKSLKMRIRIRQRYEIFACSLKGVYNAFNKAIEPFLKIILEVQNG